MSKRALGGRFYLDLVGRSRNVIVAALVAGVISGVSSAGLIALINDVANNGFQETYPVLVFGFVGLLLIRLISGVLSKFMLIQLSQKIVRDLRLALSRMILDLPFRRFEVIGIPRTMAALTDDIATLSETFGSIPILCIDLSIITACLVYIGLLSPVLLVLTLAFVSIGVFTYRWLAKKGIYRLGLARQKENVLFEHMRSMTEGFKELKLNAKRRDEFFNSHLKKTTDEYKNLNIKALKLFAVADGWGEMMFFVPVGLVLFLVPVVYPFPQEVLLGYIITIIFLIGPLSNIVNLLPGIGRSLVAAANINSLENSLENSLAIKPEGSIRCGNLQALDFSNGFHELKLTDLTYSFKDEDEGGFVFGPIDMTLYPGELVFITGGNGSGKSTLGKLITGLYTCDAGSIHLNDVALCTENHFWYRQHFSAVFADYYLFPQLMGINADYANKMNDYLNWFGLADKVSVQNDCFSTIELSSGQRRRLAMVTALLEDRAIYVFDEWAADQDMEFRQVFYGELLPALKAQAKGVIVISHDEQYFSMADRNIKLEYGKMVLDESCQVQRSSIASRSKEER